MEAAWIGVAYLFGLLARFMGLPPLLGYLLAGFVLNALGQRPGEYLALAAHVGVMFLLFSVGLKLRLNYVLRAEVWGTTLLHLSVVVAVLAPGLLVLSHLSIPVSVAVATALAFSSTVVAAKVLEAKRELRAFHGRVAIGILIVQDLIAVGLLAATAGHSPSIWAVALLAAPLLRFPLARLLEMSGHGELLVLFGVTLALVAGGTFEALGLSGELGALVAGAMLANRPKAVELSNALWGLKEVFLVGFFLLIGLSGLPQPWDIAIAVLLCLLVPLKAILFFLILLAFGLRARSAFLAGIALGSYSEFALIAAQGFLSAGLLPETWMVPLALTVALSFTIAAPLNRAAHTVYEKLEKWLITFERAERHPDEQPISIGTAQVLVMGMGRVGTAAYDFLRQRGVHVVGLDSDPGKVEHHRNAHRRVLYADAEDPGFWHKLHLGGVRAILLAVPDLEAKVMAARQLRKKGYLGMIGTTNVHAEDTNAITAAGADMTFNYFSEAGAGFAEHIWQALHSDPARVPHQAAQNSST